MQWAHSPHTETLRTPPTWDCHAAASLLKVEKESQNKKHLAPFLPCDQRKSLEPLNASEPKWLEPKLTAAFKKVRAYYMNAQSPKQSMNGRNVKVHDDDCQLSLWEALSGASSRRRPASMGGHKDSTWARVYTPAFQPFGEQTWAVIRPPGVRLVPSSDFRLTDQLYADDLVVFGGSEADLQLALDALGRTRRSPCCSWSSSRNASRGPFLMAFLYRSLTSFGLHTSFSAQCRRLRTQPRALGPGSKTLGTTSSWLTRRDPVRRSSA